MAEDLVIQEVIEQKIYLIRGQKVMLDRDLAVLYGVTTGNLNKAVSRNLDRFPQDFMFKLTEEEFKNLIFQFGRSKRGGTRKNPQVFTEHGILMLSSVLNSQRAVQVNIQITRTFVHLRTLLQSHKEILEKIETMEKNYDRQFRIVFQIIRELNAPEEKKKKKIGFETEI